MKKYLLCICFFVCAFFQINSVFASSVSIKKIEDFSIDNARKVGGVYEYYSIAQGKRYELDYTLDAGTELILMAKLADGNYGIMENQGKSFYCYSVASAMTSKPVLSGKRTMHVFDSYRSNKTNKSEQVVTLEFYSVTPDGKLTLVSSVTYGYDRLITKK